MTGADFYRELVRAHASHEALVATAMNMPQEELMALWLDGEMPDDVWWAAMAAQTHKDIQDARRQRRQQRMKNLIKAIICPWFNPGDS